MKNEINLRAGKFSDADVIRVYEMELNHDIEEKQIQADLDKSLIDAQVKLTIAAMEYNYDVQEFELGKW